MSAYIKMPERSQIKDLMLHLKFLEKLMKHRPKKPYKESTKQKVCSLKKINKNDRLLANLNEMRRDKTQISKIRNAKVEITTKTKEIQEIITDYLENLYSNKFENIE
jgi:hypothetical protein